jgi:hypothetical protein
VADFYKPSLVIPIAFSLSKEAPEDVPMLARKNLRKELHRRRILSDVMTTLQKSFSPFLPENDSDRLLGTSEEVTSHVNYGNSRGALSLSKLEEKKGDEADVTYSKDDQPL